VNAGDSKKFTDNFMPASASGLVHNMRGEMHGSLFGVYNVLLYKYEGVATAIAGQTSTKNVVFDYVGPNNNGVLCSLMVIGKLGDVGKITENGLTENPSIGFQMVGVTDANPAGPGLQHFVSETGRNGMRLRKLKYTAEDSLHLVCDSAYAENSSSNFIGGVSFSQENSILFTVYTDYVFYGNEAITLYFIKNGVVASIRVRCTDLYGQTGTDNKDVGPYFGAGDPPFSAWSDPLVFD
jgi:hypothetical protein